MPISDIKKERIATVIIEILLSKFESFPNESTTNRNAPFHKAFLNAFQEKFEGRVQDTTFFISMSSWLHGLNTTLGQKFFEEVAHILSEGEKITFKDKQIIQIQQNRITQIMTELNNNNRNPNLEYEDSRVLIEGNGDLIEASSFTADVFIEDDDAVSVIELKSVRPNKGEMKGEKQKILAAKAVLFREYPNKQINYYLGFPFDPTSLETQALSYDKNRFIKSLIDAEKFFAPEEILLSGELWNFLSGSENTMEELIEIINNIAQPNFIEVFNYLNDKNNYNIENTQYIEYLNQWYLLSEKRLLENKDQLLLNINDNKNLKRVFNKKIFNSKGEYSRERYLRLIENIKS